MSITFKTPPNDYQNASTTFIEHRASVEKPILCINVGGTRYMFLREKVEEYPHTLLGQLATLGHSAIKQRQLCDAYIKNRDEYYFDRSSKAFEAIAQFYRLGILHQPEDVCFDEFISEVRFWKLNAVVNPNSCIRCTHATRRRFRKDNLALKNIQAASCDKEYNEPIFQKRYRRLRDFVWNLMENPSYSVLAMIFSFISISFIVLTVIVQVLGSIPGHPFQVCQQLVNQANESKTSLIVEQSSTVYDCEDTTTTPALRYTDTAIIIWFSLEYLFRFWSTPHRSRYVRSLFSVIDLLSVVPFYFEQGIFLAGLELLNTSKKARNSMEATRIARLIRVLRVLRVLKLAQYSFGMKVLAVTLRRSLSELLLMVFYMLLAALFVSTLLYFIEGDVEGSPYFTIPAAAWWSIVTLLNFADAPPLTIAGKVIAAIGAIVGVLLLAFPITIVVDKFSRTYEELKEEAPPVDEAS